MRAGGDSAKSGGIGFFSALTLLFVALKLTGFIDWSWWWVTAPTWGPIALIIAIFIAWLVGAFAVDFVARPFLRWWRK